MINKRIKLFSKLTIKRTVYYTLPIIQGIVLVLTNHLILNLWWVEFLSFLVPFIVVSNLLILFLLLYQNEYIKYKILPFIVLLISLKAINETLAFNFFSSRSTATFTVTSFNIATFNPYRFSNIENDLSLYNSFYNYLKNDSRADILCIQEFHHSDNERYEKSLDSIVELGNYTYYYTNPYRQKNQDGLFGTITFSKFQSHKFGEIKSDENIIVRGHWNDFIIQNDTVRVINFHFESMSIRWKRNENQTIMRSFFSNFKLIYKKLKSGYEKREIQILEIVDIIEGSPHPVVLCADINALPYSDTYQLLKKNLNNSFEKKGIGFGFTYNLFPWYIRIDNQFFDDNLEINHFETEKKVTISDHYPITAGYSFK